MENSNLLKNLLKQFQSKKTQDYTYLTVFFILFSVFLFFAIRPSLDTAVRLQQEENDLKKLDIQYEQLITSIVDNQASLERVRDRLPLLNQALPRSPEINTVIKDIETVGSEHGVSFQTITVGQVDLVQKDIGKVRPLVVNIGAAGRFEDLIQFIQGLYGQRRLKFIKNLSITKSASTASGSGQLNAIMQIEGYYL